MARKKILFVSHKKTQCGVYEFGKNITDVLRDSQRYDFIRVECSSLAELRTAIELNQPIAIIYNYHPSVLPWVATKIVPRLYKNNLFSIKIPQIGIIHEGTQEIADTAASRKIRLIFGRYKLINSLFDFYISSDPTLLLKNPAVYKTGRLVPRYHNNFSVPAKPIFGSFGFGTPNKGFEDVVRLVQQEFDEGEIRFNIPAADFGDQSGAAARQIEENCRQILTKPGINLVITHDFFDAVGVLDFLARNTVNIFLYKDMAARGVSSVIDSSLAAQRPIAISQSTMFRHVLASCPAICVKNNSLTAIINNGFEPLRKFCDEWNPANLLWDYERIVDAILLKEKRKNMPAAVWLRDSGQISEDDRTIDTSIKYDPIVLPLGAPFNRILDNSARKLYAPTIAKLWEVAPQTMARKISEANVQQAFVFDTVYRYLAEYASPRLLCVGSYEDTASFGLIKMGVSVAEIDPVQNYSLQEYVTKPNVKKESYDIIFSTSVLEHDPDDESFMRAVGSLLAPGGVAIITCDYKEDWRTGEDKPEVDVRLYTKDDLEKRLLSYVPDCVLVDRPQWGCPDPDFNYLGKYRYTFATFVIKKNK